MRRGCELAPAPDTEGCQLGRPAGHRQNTAASTDGRSSGIWRSRVLRVGICAPMGFGYNRTSQVACLCTPWTDVAIGERP